MLGGRYRGLAAPSEETSSRRWVVRAKANDRLRNFGWPRICRIGERSHCSKTASILGKSGRKVFGIWCSLGHPRCNALASLGRPESPCHPGRKVTSTLDAGARRTDCLLSTKPEFAHIDTRSIFRDQSALLGRRRRPVDRHLILGQSPPGRWSRRRKCAYSSPTKPFYKNSREKGESNQTRSSNN